MARRCEPCRLSLLIILGLSVARTHCRACVRPQLAISINEQPNLPTARSHVQYNLRELFPPLLPDQLICHLWWCVCNNNGSRKIRQFDIDCQPSVTLRSNGDRALSRFEFQGDPEFTSSLINVASSRSNHIIMSSSPVSFTSASCLLQPNDAITRCIELCLQIKTSC